MIDLDQKNLNEANARMEQYASVRKLTLLAVADALEKGIADNDLARPAVLELRFIIKSLRRNEMPYE